MPIQDKTTLKNYFNTGDTPTEQEFANLIDSTVLKVNGMLPDANGEVTVTNITGTATGVTGNIPIAQVSGLQAGLDSKMNLTTFKTVNGQLITGDGNIELTPARHIGMIYDEYNIPVSQTVNNAFPSSLSTYSLLGSKTYFVRGRYIILNGVAQNIGIGLPATTPANVHSLIYIVTAFAGSINGNTASSNRSQITGGGTQTLLTNVAAQAYATLEFEGIVRCIGASDILPKVTLSVNTVGSTMKLGSFIEFTEVGNSSSFTKIGSVS